MNTEGHPEPGVPFESEVGNQVATFTHDAMVCTWGTGWPSARRVERGREVATAVEDAGDTDGILVSMVEQNV